MYRRVQSSIVLKSDLEGVLRATWAAHNGLAGALPVREVQIYQAGFQAALQAVELAVGVQWADTETHIRAAGLPSLIEQFNERNEPMKKLALTDIGAQILDDACGLGCAKEEGDALDALLHQIENRELMMDIDQAIGAYSSALRDAGFLAGLAVGRDPLAVLIEA